MRRLSKYIGCNRAIFSKYTNCTTFPADVTLFRHLSHSHLLATLPHQCLLHHRIRKKVARTKKRSESFREPERGASVETLSFAMMRSEVVDDLGRERMRLVGGGEAGGHPRRNWRLQRRRPGERRAPLQRIRRRVVAFSH